MGTGGLAKVVLPRFSEEGAGKSTHPLVFPERGPSTYLESCCLRVRLVI